MTRIAMFVLTAGLLVSVTTLAFTATRESGGPGGPGGPMGRPPGFGGPRMPGGMMGPAELFDQLTGTLALTDTQRDRLEKIREEHVRDDIHARAELEIARLDLRRLVDADEPDRGAINAQIDRIAQMEAGLHKSRMSMMLDSRAVLTAAQAKKLKTLRAARGRDAGPDHDPPRPREGGRTM